MEKIGNTRIKVSDIPVIGFLIALELILSRFLSINTPIVRIGFGFVPVSFTAIMYGPWWAATAYAIGDVIGAFVMPTGPYFPGFTLTAFLTGLTFGFFLKDKDITWKTVLPASIIVCIGLNLALDTFWLYILMNQGVVALLPARILKSVIMIPLQITIIPLLWNKVGKTISNRLSV